MEHETTSKADLSLPKAVIEQASARGLTIAVAESLTGGELAATIVSVAGASDTFLGGVVSYAPRIKMQLLGVSAAVIETQGTVNSPVAAQMAEGVRQLMGSDIGLSTTGVAGPGPNEGHPAGTVFIGYSDETGIVTEERFFPGDRTEIRRASTEAALSLLLQRIS